MGDVTMSKDRGFDAQNRQLVYKSITSFKDRYDDIKTRSRFSMSLKKKPSLKRLAMSDVDSHVLGKPLGAITQDKDMKQVNLKKTLLSYNTMRRFGGTYTGRSAGSPRSDIDIIMESDDEEDEEEAVGNRTGYVAVGGTVEMMEEEDRD